MRPGNLSLRARMIAVSSVGIVALTLVYCVVVLDRVGRAQRAELDKRGAALAAQLAEQVELPTRAGDLEGVQRALAEAAGREGALEVSVTVGGETIRAGRGGSGASYTHPVQASPPGFADEVEMMEATPAATTGPPAGEVRVTLSLDSIDRLLNQIRWALVVAALAVGGMAILLAVAVARRLTRPLAELAAEAEKIGAGDFEARVEKNGGGAEIGALAENMNRMAENLQKTLARMIQQEKMAGLGRMASGITHEIGNPLNSILLDAGMLAASLPEGPERETATAIRDQARRMKDIVHHLLDYARPARIEPEPVDLNRALDEALRVLSHPLRKSRLTIDRHLPEGLPRVRGTENMCVQVLVNVIANAIEATGEDGRLEIRGEAAEREVALTMADNGPGIAPEMRETMFEPFFTTRRENQGTGIGLSISRQIMGCFNGSICAEPCPVGARICLRFPVWTENG